MQNLAKELIKLHGDDLDSIMSDSDFCCDDVEQDFDNETTTYTFCDESKITVGTTSAKAH
jgi:hypothetical protein